MSESVLPPKLYASSSPKMPAKSLQKIHMVVLLHILCLDARDRCEVSAQSSSRMLQFSRFAFLFSSVCNEF